MTFCKDGIGYKKDILKLNGVGSPVEYSGIFSSLLGAFINLKSFAGENNHTWVSNNSSVTPQVYRIILIH